MIKNITDDDGCEMTSKEYLETNKQKAFKDVIDRIYMGAEVVIRNEDVLFRKLSNEYYTIWDPIANKEQAWDLMKAFRYELITDRVLVANEAQIASYVLMNALDSPKSLLIAYMELNGINNEQ